MSCCFYVSINHKKKLYMKWQKKSIMNNAGSICTFFPYQRWTHNTEQVKDNIELSKTRTKGDWLHSSWRGRWRMGIESGCFIYYNAMCIDYVTFTHSSKGNALLVILIFALKPPNHNETKFILFSVQTRNELLSRTCNRRDGCDANRHLRKTLIIILPLWYQSEVQ